MRLKEKQKIIYGVKVVFVPLIVVEVIHVKGILWELWGKYYGK